MENISAIKNNNYLYIIVPLYSEYKILFCILRKISTESIKSLFKYEQTDFLID